MVDRIVVTFEGDGAGVGGLTWGQQQVWRAMVEVDSSMSMGGVVPITDGRTLPDFVEELRFLMSRYAALRSRLVFDEPWHATSVDACHLVRQEIAARGEAYLEVHDAGPGEDPAAVAAAVFTAWKARNFDYAAEWPIREAVVRQDDTITHVIVLVCHIAADGSGLGTMIREMGERDPVTRQPRRPYTAMQPLALVAAQRGAQKQTDTALRYWETQLRSIRPRRFPVTVDRGEPRWRRVVWRSTALMLASERVAAELGIDTAPVLLAAYGAAFNTVTGQTAPFATQVIVSNRFRPGLADVVTPLAQNGLVVVDVSGVTARDVIGRARRASMNASKHAYYEPAARLALIDRIGLLHGEPVDLAVFYNDRRVGVLQAPDPLDTVPSDADIRSALPLTELVSETPMVYFNEKLMVNVDDVVGTIQITVEVDTHHLAIEDLYRLLAEMESFTVSAATSVDQAVASM
ncbi:condensation domain-containing protein [Dactylosporangium sp. NBC_01737]|uniref:condensation domain-containing protein n=1 Tax=Dactylosporangium sp. NBC_01737 TaxID=2975959 RepID=UPI002E1371CF|nr:condensation domain-containing protein [Dactylosporangium sp. NBC_01737]